MRWIITWCAAWAGVASMVGAQSLRPVDSRAWMNPVRSTERRVQALLKAMTLEEKFWQLYMAPGDPRADTTWKHGAFGVQLLVLRSPLALLGPAPAAAAANAVQRQFVEHTRLGIPAIIFEEGVHGLMQRGATLFPSAIGMAATFDTTLVSLAAAVIARESRERGVRLLLSPVINLARDQRWGRVEETYGEDSWLSAAMGVAYSGALQRAGVVATPKHFVANHGDGGRDSYPVSLDDATLEDLHFPPFREAIRRGGAQAVMASYNSVNGLPASANPALLTQTLRRDWRFTGVVIADQGGVGGANVLHHTAADYATSTERAVRAGLDVIFQSGPHDAALFWPAFRDQRIPPAVVDTAVARVLRLKFSLGLFEHPYATDSTGGAAREMQGALAGAVAMRAAEASLVLLENRRGVLPLGKSAHRIALIGYHILPIGGYSVPPVPAPSLFDALNLARAVGDTVLFAPGPGVSSTPWTPVPTTALSHAEGSAALAGVRGEYYANPAFEGTPAAVRTDAVVDASWTFNRPARGLGTDWFSVRWSGAVDVAAGGSVRLAVEGDDGYRLWVDGALAIDADRKVSYGVRAIDTALPAGRHAVRLEYRQTTGSGRVRLLWDQRVGASEEATIANAVALARRSDVAIVTVGVVEGEFQDRSSLRLPGRQEELITRIAATGTPVVVVIAAGGAVITSPWSERASAVIQIFYPGGSAGAEAVARVLRGAASPAGRLPYTVPRSEGQLPLTYDHLPTGRGDDYVDLTGQPLYPFGYGLSYTTFEYSDLALSAQSARARDTVHVCFRVKNTGAVASDEVPQLYVRHDTAPTAQPVLALRGFARIRLRPGESREVEFPLAVTDLAVRDLDGRRRVVAGNVILYVGASSRDIRLRGTLQVVGEQR